MAEDETQTSGFLEASLIRSASNFVVSILDVSSFLLKASFHLSIQFKHENLNEYKFSNSLNL